MIAVVVTNQQMRNTTNVLILSLALADLLFIVLCVPFTGVDYALSTTQGWPFGLLWCKTVQYLIYTTNFFSIYTLILMSMDRFLAVVYPVSITAFPRPPKSLQSETLSCSNPSSNPSLG